MKKLLLALILTVLSVSPVVFAANSAEQARGAQDLSFDKVLGKVASEYSKGFQTPAASIMAAIVSGGKDRFWVTVEAAGSKERTALLEAGLDIILIRGGKVDGIITTAQLEALEKNGTFRILKKIPLSDYLSRFKDFPEADAAYHNYQETKDLLGQLVSRNSDIASLSSIGKTFEGRDIWCLRINSSARDQEASPKPGAVFIGTHHAREHLSNEVPLLFAVWLLDNRGTPEVKKYLDSLDIYVIPMLNADGAEFDVRTGSYKWQRKNMRVNPDKTIGVDLNRNYDSWFGGAGTSHSPGAETYCGPSAFSEPETRAVKQFVETRKNLKTMVTYHSYGSLVLYPYSGIDGEVADAKDAKAFVNISKKMASFTGYTSQKSSEMYTSTGDADDWAYDAAKIFGFTIELEGGGFYPGAAIIEKTVRSNVKAAAYLLSVTADPRSAE
jgi:carboxypeptidase T